MATVKSIGKQSPFGVIRIKPLNFPSGRVKIKMRNDEFVRAYVKTADGIEGYYVTEEDGKWILWIKFAANLRFEVTGYPTRTADELLITDLKRENNAAFDRIQKLSEALVALGYDPTQRR